MAAEDASPAPVSGERPETLPGYLSWEEDLQMVSTFLDRKEELEESHKEYLRKNPAIKAVLADFLQALLIQKPDDVFKFAREFFFQFSPDAPPKLPYPSHTVPSDP